jgi:16S rRNA (cytosine1402-N4)-methyltransferase
MLAEVLTALSAAPDAIIVDGTVGGGGHALQLARRLQPPGHLFGFDRDPEMLAIAAATLQGLPVTLVHAPYSQVGDELTRRGVGPVDAFLLDLGLSSDQLSWAGRGFSYASPGPLDMRFDPDESLTAQEILNSHDAESLANLFYHYGEERYSRRIARRIVEYREQVGAIETTDQLASIVRRAIPGKRGKIDPATRVFQALRIAVNDEFTILDRTLAQLPIWLKPGGRAAIISFHSLEDRRVKYAFRDDDRLKALTKKPITASADEIRGNPRARSAKLRVAEKCMNMTQGQ